MRHAKGRGFTFLAVRFSSFCFSVLTPCFRSPPHESKLAKCNHLFEVSRQELKTKFQFQIPIPNPIPHQRPYPLRAAKDRPPPAAEVAAGKTTARHYLAITTGSGIIARCGREQQNRKRRVGHPPVNDEDAAYNGCRQWSRYRVQLDGSRSMIGDSLCGL